MHRAPQNNHLLMQKRRYTIAGSSTKCRLMNRNRGRILEWILNTDEGKGVQSQYNKYHGGEEMYGVLHVKGNPIRSTL